MDDKQQKELMEFLDVVLSAKKPELLRRHNLAFPGYDNSGRRETAYMTANEIRSDLIVAKVHELTK
jgi:hypothetical protein